MECKCVFFKIFPIDVIHHIFEYDVSYKEIMDEILKKDIKVPFPDLYHFNNCNGPKLKFACIRTGPIIVRDITATIQNLYGKKQNWNRRAQIVKFNPDYIGNQLELVFDIYHVYTITLQINEFLHINPRGLMPPTLQNCLFMGLDPDKVNPYFRRGHFTDKAYSTFVREIQQYRLRYE